MKLTKKGGKMSKKLKTTIAIIAIVIIGVLAGVGINININQNGEAEVTTDASKVEAEIEYAPEQRPAVIEGDRGEIIETTEVDGEEIPTVEEVDGGLFEDANTGLSAGEGEYEDLGAAIETFDTSSPEAFKNATIGRCIYANNKFGAQCVSLARSFWVSYANRDVSTCGTGMAKGMMNCAEQNAGDDFEIHWGNSGVQAGDWLVFSGGQYGHVGMALGPIVNGYVALLGENQGGRACTGGGAATNIININTKDLIGFYRPKSYIIPPAPEPEPEPAIDVCKVREVKKGDTMGKIMKECTGETKWGTAMNEYARHWVSTKINAGNTVFYGWTHGTGYGLYYDDVIEWRD